jgi:hypothetical protein
VRRGSVQSRSSRPQVDGSPKAKVLRVSEAGGEAFISDASRAAGARA